MSWSNDKGLDNPETVNIRGPQGLPGANGTNGEKGDKGDKGDSFKYDDFTPEQLNELKGEKGEKGETGAQGPKGDTGDSGVYIGTEAPSDPSIKVWINPDAIPTSETWVFTMEDGSEIVKEVCAV